MKTFTEFFNTITELISYRKKHKGATHKMSATDKKAAKIRAKKKERLGIEKDSKYKLKDGKKVKKTSDEIKRKVVSRG